MTQVEFIAKMKAWFTENGRNTEAARAALHPYRKLYDVPEREFQRVLRRAEWLAGGPLNGTGVEPPRGVVHPYQEAAVAAIASLKKINSGFRAVSASAKKFVHTLDPEYARKLEESHQRRLLDNTRERFVQETIVVSSPGVLPPQPYVHPLQRVAPIPLTGFYNPATWQCPFCHKPQWECVCQR